MKTFDFLADRLPFGHPYNFDNYLFNKIKHINTQCNGERADYFIVNNVKKRIEGKIHFLILDRQAYSPYKSLFGSFEFNPRIHPNLLKEFWLFIENDLKSRNIAQITITNYADCYSPAKARTIVNVLQDADFTIVREAVNHHITVTQALLEDRMHPMEVRRLNKCRKNNFTFQEEEKENSKEVYDFLALCRREQGINLSITKETFDKYLDQFPQDYFMFSVRHDGDLLAASITIKAHRKILYNFLPGSLKKFNKFSPTVMLYTGLYEYCQKHLFELLDLGISTEKDGKNQESLIEFKQNMGGEKSYKYFFEKEVIPLLRNTHEQ